MSIEPAVHQREKLKELYKFHGLLWQPVRELSLRTGNESFGILLQPFCPKCKATLTEKSDHDVECELCNIKYEATPTIRKVAELADKAYNAKIKQGWRVETLDLPPGMVKSEDEDENYWIEARMGQQNGKLMAIVYFGGKINTSPGKKDHAQVFLDIEDEQMRFDKANKNPLEIIAKLEAQFETSKHISEKTKE